MRTVQKSWPHCRHRGVCGCGQASAHIRTAYGLATRQFDATARRVAAPGPDRRARGSQRHSWRIPGSPQLWLSRLQVTQVRLALYGPRPGLPTSRAITELGPMRRRYCAAVTGRTGLSSGCRVDTAAIPDVSTPPLTTRSGRYRPARPALICMLRRSFARAVSEPKYLNRIDLEVCSVPPVLSGASLGLAPRRPLGAAGRWLGPKPALSPSHLP